MKKLTISLVLPMMLLTACGGPAVDEKQSFIEATVEVTCMVFQAEDLLDPSLEQKTKDIFSEHGFDVEDEAAMEEVTARYENDPDVQSAVEEALAECAGDLMKAFEGMGEGMGEALVEGMEDAEEVDAEEVDAEEVDAEEADAVEVDAEVDAAIVE